MILFLLPQQAFFDLSKSLGQGSSPIVIWARDVWVPLGEPSITVGLLPRLQMMIFSDYLSFYLPHPIRERRTDYRF